MATPVFYDASLTYSVQCPPTAPLLGYSGAAFAVIFSSIGAAYGTCKSGVGIAGMGVNNPSQVMKALIPVVMAGVIGIYGLIVAVIISTNVEAPSNQNFQPRYSLFTGFGQFFAGVTIGLSGLAAGVCVGVVGDAGVRGFGQEPKLFVGKFTTLSDFCFVLNVYGRHDFGFNFRRGIGSLWPHCGSCSEWKSIRREIMRFVPIAAVVKVSGLAISQSK